MLCCFYFSHFPSKLRSMAFSQCFLGYHDLHGFDLLYFDIELHRPRAEEEEIQGNELCIYPGGGIAMGISISHTWVRVCFCATV